MAILFITSISNLKEVSRILYSFLYIVILLSNTDLFSSVKNVSNIKLNSIASLGEF
jgi:hypothetical protein